MSTAERLALALEALVKNEGLDVFVYLDKGIGSSTKAGQRWLEARAAVAAYRSTPADGGGQGVTPLTEEQIEMALDAAGVGHQRGEDIVLRPWWLTRGSVPVVKIVRAIESAHRIGTPASKDEA